MKLNEIFAQKLLLNVIAGIVVAALIVLTFSGLLTLLTRHNMELEVPDFSNMTYEEACEAAKTSGVRIAVADSVYIRHIKRGVIFAQNPQAGSMVKKGRHVFITINAKNPKKVIMPSLVGFSTRQARAELVSKGLALKKLEYVPDIATNVVLEQHFKGREIAPGTTLDAGSGITLVVGCSESDGYTIIPDLTGVSYSRAIDMIQENSLNVGKAAFNRRVKNYQDSLNAVVVGQNPAPSIIRVRMGTTVSFNLNLPSE